MAGARIDQTTCRLAAECVVEAGLIARNASVNLIGAIFRRLIHKLAVGQHGPRHRNQIGFACGQHIFGHLRHVNAVGGDDGN